MKNCLTVSEHVRIVYKKKQHLFGKDCHYPAGRSLTHGAYLNSCSIVLKRFITSKFCSMELLPCPRKSYAFKPRDSRNKIFAVTRSLLLLKKSISIFKEPPPHRPRSLVEYNHQWKGKRKQRHICDHPSWDKYEISRFLCIFMQPGGSSQIC